MTARRLAVLVGAALLVATPAAAQTGGAASTVPYVVQTGDTLFDIGAQYLVRTADYRQVQRLNRVNDPRRMPVGRTLNIPVRLLKSVPDAATVANFRGTATLTRDGRSTALTAGQTLSEGSIIATGANAFVRVALSDGSHVVIPSNSRVRLSRVRRILLNDAVDHEMTVQSGRAESRVTPRRAPGGFVVRTPVSVSAVRGTDFRVFFDDATGRSVTEVVEGDVRVRPESAGGEVVVTEAEGAVTTPGEARRVSLLPAPRLTNPDLVQMDGGTTFDIIGLEGADRYHGRLATDAGMVDVFSEAVSASGERRLAFSGISDGLYFLQLGAVSAEGVEGLPMIYSFVQARNGLSGLAASAIGDPLDRRYQFRWEPVGEGEAVFRFQLWSEGGEPETPLIDEADLTETQIALTGLPAGAYLWRVQGVRQRFGKTLEVWSEPRPLHIGR
jgi:hypothetical protein